MAPSHPSESFLLVAGSDASTRRGAAIRAAVDATVAAGEPPIDPARRVLVPRESAQGVFRTTDREVYVRDRRTGAIRHAQPRARGKTARRAEKAARRAARDRR